MLPAASPAAVLVRSSGAGCDVARVAGESRGRAQVKADLPDPGRGAGLGGPVVVPRFKVRPPVPRPGQVRRVALLGELAEETFDFVLVLAPAGFGKTTMISQWASSTDRVVAWATASETDVDPIVLISTILAALRASGVDSTGSLGVLTGDEPAFSRRVLPQF